MPKAMQLGEEARKQSPGLARFIGRVATIATEWIPAGEATNLTNRFALARTGNCPLPVYRIIGGIV
jgi:hypothetical protein